MPKKKIYIIGRVYNKYGAADYYAGRDENNVPMFAGTNNPQLVAYTDYNTAFGMTIRLKNLLPTIIGGNPAYYEVVEMGKGIMSLKQKIREINAEWADAGDDVPVELKYIRLLEGRIANAIGGLRAMIDGGTECSGLDSEITSIIKILEEPAKE